MIERTSFNIFARPHAPPPAPVAEEPVATPELGLVERPSPAQPATDALAAHPDAVAGGEQPMLQVSAAEELAEEPYEEEPPFLATSASDEPLLSLQLTTPYPALADQLALTPQAAITLHAALPEQPPTPLASTTGLYQPASHDAPQGIPQTGLAIGTRILTTRGEVPVEALEPGDVALGLRGPALLPIAWIGRSQAHKPGVQIEPGALGPDTPRRTLRLAADHPVFVQPHPMPARSLVNGGSIQAVELEGAELFHVDVGSSDVLFAEGVPLSSDRRATP